jgi:CheY-like chemotaxis protein
MHLLLVEDHQDTRIALAEHLTGCGHRVVAVATAADALAACERDTFDVLVLDIFLPDGDGRDLLRTIHAKHGTTPAVALSANGMAQDVKSCLEAGFKAHLLKPLGVYELAETISSILPPETGHAIPSRL